MGNKYFAKRTTIDGITFDSKTEAKRYGELKLLEKLGKINNIEIHPPYDLHIKEYWTGEYIKIGRYSLDFRYWDVEKKSYILEDVKGWDKKAKKGKGDWLVTPMSKWKKRHVEAEYGIKVDYV